MITQPTIKQKKAFKNMVGNGGNVTQAMIDAKYSPATANTPQKLTESEGYKMLLEESGLTQELIATSLVDDIKAKPKARLGELSLGADILGMKQKGNSLIAVQVNVADDRANFK